MDDKDTDWRKRPFNYLPNVTARSSDRVFENISRAPPELSTEYLVNAVLLFRNSGLSEKSWLPR